MLGSLGSMVGLMVTSKRVDAKADLPVSSTGKGFPVGSLLTQTSTGGPPTLADSSGSVSCRLLLLSSGSRCMHNFVCASKTGVSFPQSSGRPTIRPHWPSRPDSLGIPSPFEGTSRFPGKPDVEFRTFTRV